MSFFQTQTYVVDDEDGIAILHPDVLISGTSLSNSFACLRRAVLNERIRDGGGSNIAALYGNMAHSVMQEGLVSRSFSSTTLSEFANSVLSDYADELASLKEPDEVARAKMQEYVHSVSLLIPSQTLPTSVAAKNSNFTQKHWHVFLCVCPLQ